MYHHHDYPANPQQELTKWVLQQKMLMEKDNQRGPRQSPYHHQFSMVDEYVAVLGKSILCQN